MGNKQYNSRWLYMYVDLWSCLQNSSALVMNEFLRVPSRKLMRSESSWISLRLVRSSCWYSLTCASFLQKNLPWCICFWGAQLYYLLLQILKFLLQSVELWFQVLHFLRFTCEGWFNLCFCINCLLELSDLWQVDIEPNGNQLILYLFRNCRTCIVHTIKKQIVENCRFVEL